MSPIARVRALIAFMALALVPAWTLIPALRHDGRGLSFAAVIAFAIAFAVADRVQVHVEVRRQTFSLGVSEIPLLLGVFLLPAPWLLGCRVAGAVVVVLARRTPAVKAWFNVALAAWEPAIAVICVHAVLPHGGKGPMQWLAGAAGMLAVDTFCAAMVLLVMTILQERMPREQVQVLVPTTAISGAVNILLGLVALVLVDADVRTVALLAALAALLSACYRAYSSLLRRHANLDRLSQFTQAVAAADVEPDALLDVVLHYARVALRGEYASVWLTAGDGYQHRICREDMANTPLHAVSLDPARTQVVIDGQGALLPAGAHPAVDLAVRDSVVVPLVAKSGSLGLLEVGNRITELGTFDRVDLQFLQALSSHAAVALDHQRLLERFRHEATHDSLTGLANRAQFTRVATERLAVACEDGRPVTVLMMDLDRFKDVNDTLGHHAGDQLLVVAAQRLTASLPAGAMIARLGGDEFAILLDQPGHDASAVAADLHAALHSPIPIDGFSLEASASIGIARSPEHGDDAELLLQRADIAMYAAKNAASSSQYYAEGLDHSSPRRLALVSELRHAIRNGQLVLHYQPKVSLADRTVTGVEALVRWQHPVHGMVMPDEFIPIAEHTGLIGDLTRWVLDTALRQVNEWQDEGLQLGVAVNLSPRGLLDSGFPDEVRDLLREHDVDPGLLTLELTETTVMTDPERGLPLLKRLHDAGVAISVDDFGTGYSSLAYLRRLPVDEVKIDKSFVRNISTVDEDAAVVRTILELARSLGLRAVAEGVEDETTRDALNAMGCPIAQGYLFSRALDVEQFRAWLTVYATPKQRRRDDVGAVRRLESIA